MHSFDGKNLWQGCSSWGLGSFFVYLSYGKIQYLILIANIFDFNYKYIWFQLQIYLISLVRT